MPSISSNLYLYGRLDLKCSCFPGPYQFRRGFCLDQRCYIRQDRRDFLFDANTCRSPWRQMMGADSPAVEKIIRGTWRQTTTSPRRGLRAQSNLKLYLRCHTGQLRSRDAPLRPMARSLRSIGVRDRVSLPDFSFPNATLWLATKHGTGGIAQLFVSGSRFQSYTRLPEDIKHRVSAAQKQRANLGEDRVRF